MYFINSQILKIYGNLKIARTTATNPYSLALASVILYMRCYKNISTSPHILATDTFESSKLYATTRPRVQTFSIKWTLVKHYEKTTGYCIQGGCVFCGTHKYTHLPSLATGKRIVLRFNRCTVAESDNCLIKLIGI